jgi:UDP-N-acetyl-D-glucosamine dehydrogenase
MDAIATRTARVAVVGLGYVGLPLAVELSRRFETCGIDVSQDRVDGVNRGKSYIGDIESTDLALVVKRNRLRATTDFDAAVAADIIIICVPTPLDAGKVPDVSYITDAAVQLARRLRRNQLIVLESTTYPGTTDELLLPMLQETGLKLDRDFLLAFSPERVDPGNREFRITNIPKVVGGCSQASTEAAAALYATVAPSVHSVPNARVAETAKLWENTFRSVNIALANEMGKLCYSLGINSSDVIEAAKTKPFGFMPFYPGPGVGGHCIPLDPHYLSFKASEHGTFSQFISLADQINSSMPDHVVELVGNTLNDESKALRGSRILLLGVAYKANVEDTRHSPALAIIDRLRSKGAEVCYHDALVPHLTFSEGDLPPAPRRDAHENRLAPLDSISLTADEVSAADCVVVLAAHRGIDYAWLQSNARVIVDTGNIVPSDNGQGARVVKL